MSSVVDSPFRDISRGHSIRLDQVVTKLPFGGADGPLRPIAFNRLLMGGQLPDGSHTVVSVVDRACEIKVANISQSFLEEVPESAKIDFVE